MDGRDKLPDDGKIQTQGREDDAATPLAEGGEKTSPERFPPVKKDDSVEPPAAQRSFEGDASNPEPRREPDPSVSHGQSDPDEATAPDDGRR